MAAKGTVNIKILGDAKGLQKELANAEGGLKGFAGKAGKLVAAAAVASGAAVAAGLAKGFSDAIGAEAGVDLLQGQLGITEAEAAELGNVAGGVYRDAWGGSLSEVQGYVGNLASSFKDIGVEELESLTPKAIALGDAFGIDVAAGVQTASELVSSGLAGSADEAFDLLTTGLQKMPAGIRDELLAASDEYGDFFADLGFSGDEAFALLTTAAEDGVYGIDKTGDALKELSIRATDMSTASVDAFSAAGLNAEDMAGQFLEGGDVARGALDKTIEGLLGIEDPVEQSQAAIALFGSPLEDLSVSEIPAFLDSLTDMSGGMGGVEGAAQDLADTIGGNTSAEIEAFKRQALGKLADFATNTMIPAMRALAPVIQGAFQWVVDNKGILIAAFSGLATVLLVAMVPAWVASGTAAAAAAVAFLAANAPILAVAAVLGVLVAGLIYAYNNFEGFRNVVDTVVDFLTDTVWPAIQAFADFVGDVFSASVAFVRKHWDTIQRVVKGVMDFVRAYVSNVIKVVQGVIDTVMGVISGDWRRAWDGIKAVFSGVWAQIKLVVTAGINIVKGLLSAAWPVIKRVLAAAWDAMKAKVSDSIDGIIEFVKGLPGRAKSALSSVMTTLVGKGKDIITGLKNGMIEKFNDTRAWVGELPSRILGALGSTFTLLKNAGRNVLNGLWNGMKEKWNDVKNWVGGLGSKIIGLKGPPAYDKVMLENNGELIMGGLLNGMKSGWDDVEGFLKSRTVAIPDLASSVDFGARLSVDGSAGSSVSSGRSSVGQIGASVQIGEVHMHNGTDVNALSASLAMALA